MKRGNNDDKIADRRKAGTNMSASGTLFSERFCVRCFDMTSTNCFIKEIDMANILTFYGA
jgi:hypothetical protein